MTPDDVAGVLLVVAALVSAVLGMAVLIRDDESAGR